MENMSIRRLGYDSVLREKSHDVNISSSNDINNLIARMRELMVAHDGIGIAAPQIGESVRMFLVAKSLFPQDIQAKLPSDVFINPRVIRKSFKKVHGEEGCLSVPGVFGDVKRSKRITVEAFDASWKKFRFSAEGLLARVLQHELDHLEGILYIDRVTEGTLHELLPSGEIKPWKFSTE